MQSWVAAALRRSLELQGQLRPEGQGGAICSLKGRGGDEGDVVGGGDEVKAGTESGDCGRLRFARGRIEGEIGPIDVGSNVTDMGDYSVDDVGDRVRVSRIDEDFASFGIDA